MAAAAAGLLLLQAALGAAGVGGCHSAGAHCCWGGLLSWVAATAVPLLLVLVAPPG